MRSRSVEAAGQSYAQSTLLICIGGTITANTEVSAAERRASVTWGALRRYGCQLHDRPTTVVVPLALKVRLFRAEVCEDLLQAWKTWCLHQEEYEHLRTQHHQLLLRCVGFRKKQRTD